MSDGFSLLLFYNWIFRFRKEKSDRGILARWFYSNDEFKHISDKQEVLNRMTKSGCSEFLIETFSKIWDEEFTKISNAKISMPTVTGKGGKSRSRLG